MKKMFVLLGILILAGCTQQDGVVMPELQDISIIPDSADIIFTSMNHLLSDPACLGEGRILKERFITDPDCNSLIYGSQNNQVFVLDIESKNITQVTNNDCYYIGVQVVDQKTIMTNAMCNDTNDDGKISATLGGDNDESELYLMDLEIKTMNCLTCDLGLISINNPDYSSVTKKIVFSGSLGGWGSNHLFTIDLEKNIEQLTNDSDYLEFDCSWSEDGTMIVASRLPAQSYPFTIPSEVWLMNSDGTGLKQITSGGLNINNESSKIYPIGTDADPDLSPDNKEIVFSRLKTELGNVPIGVWELIIINIESGEEEIIDSNYANMIPEWKQGGITFIRQQSTEDYMNNPMSVKQSLYLYKDGEFTELENYPYNIFPMGGSSVSWIK